MFVLRNLQKHRCVSYKLLRPPTTISNVLYLKQFVNLSHIDLRVCCISNVVVSELFVTYSKTLSWLWHSLAVDSRTRRHTRSHSQLSDYRRLELMCPSSSYFVKSRGCIGRKHESLGLIWILRYGWAIWQKYITIFLIIKSRSWFYHGSFFHWFLRLICKFLNSSTKPFPHVK